MTRFRFGFAMGGTNVQPLPLKERSKRGGSGTAALTNTLDPSSYPTSPPQSSYKSGVPKIGGSEGGFIGLVVGLGVLILLCSGAVYYLLRTRKHGGRSRNMNHPPSATTSAGPSKGFFSSLRGRKQEAGWVQQGDEFDYDSEDEDMMMRKDPARVGDVPQGLGYGAGAGYGEGGTGYTGQPHPMEQHSRDTKSPPADAYTDPFDPAHLPESVRKQQAPLPSTSSSNEPPLYNSVESDSAVKHSPTSPTFEGGTKFREQF